MTKMYMSIFGKGKINSTKLCKNKKGNLHICLFASEMTTKTIKT